MATTFYRGPEYLLETAMSLDLDRESLIVDVAGGTGQLAKLVRAEYIFDVPFNCHQFRTAGFVNIDGLDGSEEMLNTARRRGIYNQTICSFLGRGHTCPIPDGKP